MLACWQSLTVRTVLITFNTTSTHGQTINTVNRFARCVYWVAGQMVWAVPGRYAAVPGRYAAVSGRYAAVSGRYAAVSGRYAAANSRRFSRRVPLRGTAALPLCKALF